eukprot:TRINITY_DN12_c0_g5_i1.p2 TRINITY_DN12_c0_g5~~TRINITY_DN12_c0_g5_i1.p2  ORF type:complete len:347 (+),score=151.74 TRINITY_DN12_c0_g5_i1:58-1098(+)
MEGGFGLSLDLGGFQEEEEQLPDIPDEGLTQHDISEINRELGFGSSGKVSLVQHNKSGELYAMKSVQMTGLSTKEINSEIQALRSHTCQYLTTFYGAFLDPEYGTMNFILEYMDVGSLQDVLKVTKEQNGGGLGEDILGHMVFQAVSGLKYIHHTMKTIHRDLKPGNMLLNSKGEVKVTDFGVSKRLDDSKASAETYIGTLSFMAPEMVHKYKQGAYNNKIDIWALGITVIELFTGWHPFKAKGCSDLTFLDYLDKLQNAPPGLGGEAHASRELCSFVDQCVCRDPASRPDCSALLGHPFLEHRHCMEEDDTFMKKYLTFVQEVRGRVTAGGDQMLMDDLAALDGL